MPRFLLPAGLSFFLAACGAMPAQPAQPPTARASAGDMAVEVTPAVLHAGDTASISLNVTGPADYEGGCAQTLHVWVQDASGRPAWEEPVPAVMCMAIADVHLAAGQTISFGAHWPVSAGFASGTYSVHGLFLFTLPLGAGTRVRENLPVVSVQVSS